MRQKPELTVAYNKLKSQWPGKLRRLVYPGRRSWPDFMMTYRGRVAFVEVKAVLTIGANLKLSKGQWNEIVELHREGLDALVLTMVGGKKWYVHVPPFMHDTLNATNASRHACVVDPQLIFGLDNGLQ